MNDLGYAVQKPLFWLVRDATNERYSRSENARPWDREKFATLLAIIETLDEIIKEDIRDGVPPHAEDLELLEVLKRGLISFEER